MSFNPEDFRDAVEAAKRRGWITARETAADLVLPVWVCIECGHKHHGVNHPPRCPSCNVLATFRVEQKS